MCCHGHDMIQAVLVRNLADQLSSRHPSRQACVQVCMVVNVCACGSAQARRQAEAIEASMRMDRLSAQAGESMVTTNTLASMDEDDAGSTALKRFNIILKVAPLRCCH